MTSATKSIDLELSDGELSDGVMKGVKRITSSDRELVGVVRELMVSLGPHVVITSRIREAPRGGFVFSYATAPQKKP